MDLLVPETDQAAQAQHTLLLNVRDQLDLQQQRFKPQWSALLITCFLGGPTIKSLFWLVFGMPERRMDEEGWAVELLGLLIGLGMLALFWLLIFRIKQHAARQEAEYLSRQLAGLPLELASRAAFHWSAWDSRRSASRLHPAQCEPRSGWIASIDGIKRDYFQAAREAGRPAWHHAWTRRACFILPSVAVLSFLAKMILYAQVSEANFDRLFSLTTLSLTLWILVWAVFDDVRSHALHWALLQRVNLALSHFPASGADVPFQPAAPAGRPG